MSAVNPTKADEIIGDALRDGAVSFSELLGHDGPGRFEGNSNVPLAVALDAIIRHGGEDESTGETDCPIGHVARVDRWLVLTDDRGFVSAIEYTTVDNAQLAFADYERAYAVWSDEADCEVESC